MDYHRYLELKHSGVLGMRWGRRKAEPPSLGRTRKPKQVNAGRAVKVKAGKRALTSGQKYLRRTLIDIGGIVLSTAAAAILIDRGQETAAKIVFNVGGSIAIIDSAIAKAKYRQSLYEEMSQY